MASPSWKNCTARKHHSRWSFKFDHYNCKRDTEQLLAHFTSIEKGLFPKYVTSLHDEYDIHPNLHLRYEYNIADTCHELQWLRTVPEKPAKFYTVFASLGCQKSTCPDCYLANKPHWNQDQSIYIYQPDSSRDWQSPHGQAAQVLVHICLSLLYMNQLLQKGPHWHSDEIWMIHLIRYFLTGTRHGWPLCNCQILLKPNDWDPAHVDLSTLLLARRDYDIPIKWIYCLDWGLVFHMLSWASHVCLLWCEGSQDLELWRNWGGRLSDHDHHPQDLPENWLPWGVAMGWIAEELRYL